MARTLTPATLRQSVSLLATGRDSTTSSTATTRPTTCWRPHGRATTHAWSRPGASARRHCCDVSSARPRLTDGSAVYVDFFGVLSLQEVAERIERAYTRSLTGGAARWFDGLRRTLRPTITAGAGGVSATAHLAPVTSSLAERLDLPLKMYEKFGKRVMMVFDEFQEVIAADSNADAVLRASIQHHGDAASYIFAGSHVGMMTSLFADRRRAFYAQAQPVPLPPLPASACVEFVSSRFEGTGKDVGTALGPMLDATLGHPQRTVLLAHAVWSETPDGGTADEATTAAAHRTTDGLSLAMSFGSCGPICQLDNARCSPRWHTKKSRTGVVEQGREVVLCARRWLGSSTVGTSRPRTRCRRVTAWSIRRWRRGSGRTGPNETSECDVDCSLC